MSAIPHLSGLGYSIIFLLHWVDRMNQPPWKH